MLKVEDVNGNFIENISLEHYQSDEYLQRLYLDCMVDLYDPDSKIVKLFTQEEFKKYQKEIKKIKKNLSTEEKRKIHNEICKNYYKKNKETRREQLNKYYKEYRERKKLENPEYYKKIHNERYRNYYNKNKDEIIKTEKNKKILNP